MAEFTCICGVKFRRPPSSLGAGRCSKACGYENRIRPTGIKPVYTRPNPSWFKPGHRNVATFPAGYKPANFKEEGVGYDALHDWVYLHKGRPTKCEHCGSTVSMQWANKSWEYKRELDDWLSLCCRCHRKYDKAGAWGAVKDNFPIRGRMR